MAKATGYLGGPRFNRRPWVALRIHLRMAGLRCSFCVYLCMYIYTLGILRGEIFVFLVQWGREGETLIVPLVLGAVEHW